MEAATNVKDIQVSSEPEDPLDALNPNERASVTGMLNGLSPQDALAKKGTTSPMAVAQFLARGPVRHALQSLAPLLPDPEHAARLLAPYSLAETVAKLNGASPSQSLLAARDILALAGLSPGARAADKDAGVRALISAIRDRSDNESVGKRGKGAKRLGSGEDRALTVPYKVLPSPARVGIDGRADGLPGEAGDE
jgi:hypothetical protein